MKNIEFDPEFAQFVLSQLPAKLLNDLSHVYYEGDPVISIFEHLPTPDEIRLRAALEVYKSGDKLTDGS